MQKGRSRRPAAARRREERKRSFFHFRLVICGIIIIAASVLKASDSEFVRKIAAEVSSRLKVSEAIEVISGRTNKDAAVEVFEEKEKPAIEDNFYVDEKTEELKREAEAEAKKAEIETLSFQMSAEELADTTPATPFAIPAPSNCSYNNEKIPFKYTTPLRGTITSKYGYRNHPIIEDASFHTGLDIAAKSGTAIGAFAAGKVLETGRNATYGNYIIIDHGNGFTSFYGHNSKLNAKKGQKVNLGQKICEVGTTGMSTGPHLHFEVRKNGIRLNPEFYVSPETV